jgi:hypothetical protein
MKSTAESVSATPNDAPGIDAGYCPVTGDHQPLVINGKAGLTYLLKQKLKDVRSDQLVLTRKGCNLELCFGSKAAKKQPEIILENYYRDASTTSTEEDPSLHDGLPLSGEMSGLCADLEDGTSVYYRLGDGSGLLTATTSFGVWPLLLDLLGMAGIAAVIARRHARKEALLSGLAASSLRTVVMPLGRQTAA